MAGLRLVVGLGNPGPRFERTRHNAGFRVVERLAGPSAAWKDFHGLGLWVKKGDLLLAKPMTFMNESGRFVQSFAAYYKAVPAESLICYDEAALPLGRLRIRPKGSAGGQKGMASIIETWGTQDIPRLRVGIGPQPAVMALEDFVLQRFTPEEEKFLAQALDRAAEAVSCAASDGLAAAMDRYNSDEPVL